MNIADLERWIRRDPAGRGFLTKFEGREPPCAGNLSAAAGELATSAGSVGVVTGFFVPDAPRPAAETDGPLGAILLTDVLHACGHKVSLITDSLCAAAIRVAMNACYVNLDLEVCPVPPAHAKSWRESFWKSPWGTDLTHLISVERIGPCLSNTDEIPRCRNMRGVVIDDWSADLYRLFEERPDRVRTIGIGDGGNEIGMGRCWDQLPNVPRPPNACRTATDWTIVAGVSDWGAMALAAAVAMQTQNLAALQPWTSARIEHALTSMVTDGPAIDGCTFRAEPTVDALPFPTYIQPWELIRRELGLDAR